MAVTNAQIFQQLGELTEGQKNATESRRVMHERMDKHEELLANTAETLAQVQFALKVTTDVAVQTRDRIETLENKISGAIEPVLNDHSIFKADAEPLIRLLKNIRLGLWALVGLMSVAGVSLLSTLTFFQDTAKSAFRWWLGI